MAEGGSNPIRRARARARWIIAVNALVCPKRPCEWYLVMERRIPY